MKKLMGGIQDSDNMTRDEVTKADVTLPPSLPLREWVAHFDASQASSPSSRAGNMMNRVDKSYLEMASRLALSLAKELANVQGSDEIRLYEDVCAENVVVTDTTKGEASFTKMSNVSSNNNSSSSPS